MSSNGRHGDLVHYTITCYSEEHPGYIFTMILTPTGDRREEVIDGLLPYNTYNCCISVQTTMANSSVVCQQAPTLEEGPFKNNTYSYYV